MQSCCRKRTKAKARMPVSRLGREALGVGSSEADICSAAERCFGRMRTQVTAKASSLIIPALNFSQP